MVLEVVTEAAKEGATVVGQDLIEQGVKAHFGAQDGVDLKGAASKGLGALEESATAGLKEGVTGVKDGIVGLADPGTYVDAVTGRATQRAEEAVGQGLHHAAGGNGGSGAAAEPEPAATPGNRTPATQGARPAASAAPAPVPASVPAPAPGSGSSAGQSSAADRIRSDFG